jgi:hypothetical protein
MRKFLFSILLFFGLLLSGLLSGFVMPVSASVPANGNERLHTVISFAKVDAVGMDKPFKVAGTIADSYGRPVANKPVSFTIDGAYLGQAYSNGSGNFQRQFSKTLNAGPHTLMASYKGHDVLSSTRSHTTLEILPADLQVQTIPAIAGVTFQINGQEIVSDDHGFASIQINQPGVYRLRVLVDEYHNPFQRIEFGRWLAESYEPFQDIKVPTDKVIQIGLNVYNLVGQSFVDLDGSPVPHERIKEFSIRSTQGDFFTFYDGQPRWIPASRIAHRINGLEEVKLLYSVLNVMVDGSNVVNQAQQRFYANPNETWSISLLLYSLRVTATDALFGFPVGQSVSVEFPDGRTENYSLGETKVAEINSLARGNYYVKFMGAYGLSNRLPVALSRNQEVTAKIITYLDLIIVGMLGVLVMLGLLLYGRPSIVGSLFKRNRSIESPVESQPFS